jgi:hypothetical protein
LYRCETSETEEIAVLGTLTKIVKYTFYKLCFNSTDDAMSRHKQVFVKVNAEVDAGMATVVSTLNEVEGLQTVESCQGETGGKFAYVYFWFGDWASLSKFLFREVEPTLSDSLGADYRVSVEVFSGSRPTGKIEFSAEATGTVASALKQVVKRDRSSACSCGKQSTELRS